MKHRVKMLAARDLFASLATILIIVAAACHLVLGRNFESSSAPAPPPHVIHVRRAPNHHTVTNAEPNDCDRLEESFDPAPGWPYTAGWN